jgi:nitroreductase
MRDALRLAPSACNFQPWKFIWVQDGDLRRRVAEAANNQEWMADAPCIVVGCGRADDAYKKMGGDGSSIDVDLAIALDHLTLAAAAEGLGTCWIGAFNQAAVKELLSVPLDVKVVALTPLGRPAAPEAFARSSRPAARRRTRSSRWIATTGRASASAGHLRPEVRQTLLRVRPRSVTRRLASTYWPGVPLLSVARRGCPAS